MLTARAGVDRTRRYDWWYGLLVEEHTATKTLNLELPTTMTGEELARWVNEILVGSQPSVMNG